MLTDREVLSTLNMLRNEHLDVRTVTLGISLFDCASHDFDVFAYRVRAKIAKYAAKLVATCNEVGDKFGIPVVNKRISVSPIGVVGASFSRDQMVRACQVLDESAKDAGVDFLGGFGALVEKGITPGERNLIDALPEALATTDRICSSINVASTRSGINMDAVALLGQRILDVAEATRDRDGLGCAKLVVFANIPQDVPFMAGAYLGVGEPDVVINVGVSGPGVVKKAIDRAMENHKPGEFTLGEVAEVIKRTRSGRFRPRSPPRRASRTCPLPRRPPWGTPWAKSSRAWACPPSARPEPPPCSPCSTTPSKRAARSPLPMWAACPARSSRFPRTPALRRPPVPARCPSKSLKP